MTATPDYPAPTPARTLTVHSARVLDAVPYLGHDGQHLTIPAGPCLLEKLTGPSVQVVWGADGQSCTELPLEDIECAAARGSLVLID